MKNKVFKTSLVAAAALAVSMVAVACDGTEETTDQPEVTTYAVTYTLNGGNGTAPTQDAKAEGATFTLASGDGIYKTGFTFDGWSDGTTKYNAGDTYTMPGHEVTFTAQWETVASGATTYTVTYELNGGEGTAPTQAPLEANATFTLSTGTGLRKTGNTLTGWNDGTTDYSLGATYRMPADNVTLTAIWTPDSPPQPEKYSVTYKQTSPIPAAMGVESDPDIVVADQAAGSYTLLKPTSPYYAAYNTSNQPTLVYFFAGWKYKDQVYLPGQKITLSESATIVAQYVAATATEGEWVDTNNNSSSMHIYALTDDVGVLCYPDVIHETYVWVYFTYSISGTGANNLTATPVGGEPITGTIDTETGDLTMTVSIGATDYEFGPDQGGSTEVRVEFSFGDYNGQTDPPSYQDVEIGQKVTDPNVDVNVRTGYTLEGWHVDTKDGVKWNFETDTVTRGMTLVAKWTRLNENPMATFTKPEGATGDDPDPIEFSNTTKFPANPYNYTIEGYTFKGWTTVAKTGFLYQPNADLRGSIDITYVAVFGKDYSDYYMGTFTVRTDGYVVDEEGERYSCTLDDDIITIPAWENFTCRLNEDGTIDSADGLQSLPQTATDNVTTLTFNGFGKATLGSYVGTYTLEDDNTVTVSFPDATVTGTISVSYVWGLIAECTANVTITIDGNDYVFGSDVSEVTIPSNYDGRFAVTYNGTKYFVVIANSGVTVTIGSGEPVVATNVDFDQMYKQISFKLGDDYWYITGNRGFGDEIASIKLSQDEYMESYMTLDRIVIPEAYEGTFEGTKDSTKYVVNISWEGITVKIGDADAITASITGYYADDNEFIIRLDGVTWYLGQNGYDDTINSIYMYPSSDGIQASVLLNRVAEGGEGGGQNDPPAGSDKLSYYAGVEYGYASLDSAGTNIASTSDTTKIYKMTFVWSDNKYQITHYRNAGAVSSTTDAKDATWENVVTVKDATDLTISCKYGGKLITFKFCIKNNKRAVEVSVDGELAATWTEITA